MREWFFETYNNKQIEQKTGEMKGTEYKRIHKKKERNIEQAGQRGINGKVVY